jgi:NADH-quinone oxidoreductase subunit L
VSVVAAVAGIALAAMRYRDRIPAEQGAGWRLLGRGYYVDDVYGQVFARAGKLGAAWLAFRFDSRGIDGAVEGVGSMTRRAGSWLRPLQTGFVRSYAVAIVFGAVALLAWFLSRGAL